VFWSWPRIIPDLATWRVMDATGLRSLCLGFNGTSEEFPFGAEVSVFKVGGKMFALSMLRRTPLEVNLKCEPELAVDLRTTYEAVRPGWHMNKRHWNTVTLDGSLPDGLVRDMVEDSYDLVVATLPKRVQLQLDWSGD
jgi:predicted DNA-binding protein (MmcQ/YjbR family)